MCAATSRPPSAHVTLGDPSGEAVAGFLTALPLAVLGVIFRDRLVDRCIRVVTLLGFAMASFWLALLLMLFFGGKPRVLPVAGYGTTFGDHLNHQILPSIVIAISILPLLLRTLRAGLLEMSRLDFVRRARAKGLPARLVLLTMIG